MDVKEFIDELKVELTTLSDGLHVSIEVDDFFVTLGDNGIYYVSEVDSDIKCLSYCESDVECVCTRKFPNSYSFFTADEAANFIVLNYYDRQSEYHNQ